MPISRVPTERTEGIRAILVAASEDLFVDLLARFSPRHYLLGHAATAAQARRFCAHHSPVLAIVALDDEDVGLQREAREASAVLGLTSEPNVRPPEGVDVLVDVRRLDDLLGAARELVNERRRLPRAEVAIKVTLSDGTLSLATASSAGALFVPTEAPSPVGTEVELVLDLDGGQVSGLTTVVRVGAGDAGALGMALAVSDEVARRRLDAVVKREMMSEHQRLATERGEPLSRGVCHRLGERALELLGEAFADDPEDGGRAQGQQRITVRLERLEAIALPEDASAQQRLSLAKPALRFDPEAPTPRPLRGMLPEVEGDGLRVIARPLAQQPGEQALRDMQLTIERLELQLEQRLELLAESQGLVIQQADDLEQATKQLTTRVDALQHHVAAVDLAAAVDLVDRVAALERRLDTLERDDGAVADSVAGTGLRSVDTMPEEVEELGGRLAQDEQALVTLSSRIMPTPEALDVLKRRVDSHTEILGLLKDQLAHQRAMLRALRDGERTVAEQPESSLGEAMAELPGWKSEQE